MEFDPHEEFLMLLACVMEHDCTPFQGQRFIELMRRHPEFAAIYRRELQIDSLLRWSLDSSAFTRPCVPFACRPQPRHPHLRRSAAAAALLLACGLFAAPYLTRRLFPSPAVTPVTPAVSAPVATPTNEETTTMMTPLGTASLVLSAAVLTGIAATASEPIFVDAEVGTPHWNRIFTQTVPLAWDWNWEWVPANAAQVTLEIAGLNSNLQQTFQKPVANYTWTVYPGLPAFKEDAYTATLTFFDAAGEPLTNVTASLDALAGAFAGADVKTAFTNELAWKGIGGNVLLPYDCGWSTNTAQAETAELTWMYGGTAVSSTSLTASAVGVCPWVTKGWAKGEYRLELAFDGSAVPCWTAFVQLLPSGLIILLQ